MGYQIVMIPQVEKWLADLGQRDPAAADRVRAAFAALRDRGDSVGPPLVVSIDEQLTGGVAAPAALPHARPRRRPGSGLMRRARDLPARSLTQVGSRFALAALDAVIRRQLIVLAGARKAAAVTAMTRKRLEVDAQRLAEQSGAPDGADRIDGLRRDLAVGLSREEAATTAAGNLHAKIEAFKAARQAVEVACAEAEEAAERAQAELIDGADASGADPASPGGASRPTFSLRELRPGAPQDTGIRLLFAIEPDDTAVLLASGTDSDWLRSWYHEVIPLSRFRYQEKQRERVPRTKDP